MEPWLLILSLISAGVILMIVEIFVPGMILGLIGGGCLLASVAVGYSRFGFHTGTLLLIGETIGVTVGIMAWMKIFPKTPIGRNMILSETNSPEDLPSLQRLVGTTGKTATLCRPSGVAILDGKRYDVILESGFCEADQLVKVHRVEGKTILIRTL